MLILHSFFKQIINIEIKTTYCNASTSDIHMEKMYLYAQISLTGKQQKNKINLRFLIYTQNALKMYLFNLNLSQIYNFCV